MTATINASTTAGVVTTADTSGILQLQTNGTAALTVDASQNVGIGTTTPGKKLDILSNTSQDGIRISGSANPRLTIIDTTTPVQFDALCTDTEAVLRTDTNHPLVFSTNGTERARITSAGLVGINTTSPARTLHVKGGGVTTLANSNGALFTDASNAGVLLGSDNAIGYISGVTVTGSATANLVLQPFGGNAMVGTTTTRGKLYIHYDSNSSADPTVYFGNDGGTGVFASFGNAAGTVIGTIARSGSSTNYNTSSDYRLKNTIAPMTGALAKVGLLKPVTYKWNLDGGESQGFIAHELQTVVPECVTGEKDAVQEEQYEVTPAVKDEEGNTITEAVMGTRTVPAYQGIDTSFLVATLTAAIQELKAIVDAQGAEIAALKGATA